MFNSPVQVGQQVRYRRLFEGQYRNSEITDLAEDAHGDVWARLADGTVARTENLSPESASAA